MSRTSLLEKSVNSAVGTLSPKPECPASERNEADGSAASSPVPSPTAAPPPASLLELAERGDGETLLQMLADDRMDVLSNPPRTASGDTALHVAASGGHLKAVIVLLGAGAHVDVLGHRLRTPLHCAVAHGHLAVTQCLLNAGAQPDIKDTDGVTAIDLSARGNKELVELFLNKGVPVDPCNGDGESLLIQAARTKRWKTVHLLLEKGASATKCKEDKECALVLASRDGRADAVRHLLRRGAASNTEQVKWALGEAQSAAVVWAFVDGVPEKVRGEPGRLGLFQAALKGRLEPMVALLEAGVHFDARDGVNKTALHYASATGHVECVRELLDRGVDANAKENDGYTPLHWASSKGHVACLKELLGRGADVNTKANDEYTPLHWASKEGHAECVRALLAAGASASEKNEEGKTPLEIAKTEEVRRVLSGTIT